MKRKQQQPIQVKNTVPKTQATKKLGNTVEVYKQHTGRVMYYPSNDLAKMIVHDLLKRQILNDVHIKVIKQLGFKVMCVPNPTVQITEEL